MVSVLQHAWVLEIETQLVTRITEDDLFPYTHVECRERCVLRDKILA